MHLCLIRYHEKVWKSQMPGIKPLKKSPFSLAFSSWTPLTCRTASPKQRWSLQGQCPRAMVKTLHWEQPESSDHPAILWNAGRKTSLLKTIYQTEDFATIHSTQILGIWLTFMLETWLCICCILPISGIKTWNSTPINGCHRRPQVTHAWTVGWNVCSATKFLLSVYE